MACPSRLKRKVGRTDHRPAIVRPKPSCRSLRLVAIRCQGQRVHQACKPRRKHEAFSITLGFMPTKQMAPIGEKKHTYETQVKYEASKINLHPFLAEKTSRIAESHGRLQKFPLIDWELNCRT